MKIGIITYHRSHNYGAMLQAVALRYQLKKLGHEVFFVDYWPDYHRQMYALYSFRYAIKYGIRGALSYTKNAIVNYGGRKARSMAFGPFFEHYILPYCTNYSSNQKFDIVVYGSDQIWRKQWLWHNRFNPAYFAENLLCADRHVSYAASMGVIDLSAEDKRFLKSHLERFSDVSVRENDLGRALSQLGIKNKVVLDPTILLTGKEWNNFVPTKRKYEEKYVLYYKLQGGAFDDRQMEIFAEKHNCKLLTLDGVAKTNDLLAGTGVEDFLSLVNNAEFVFTSSFHGLAFSIIFHKQFFASFVANSGRAHSLLENIGLEHRILSPNANIPMEPDVIDFESCEVYLEKLRKYSMSFLSDALA